MAHLDPLLIATLGFVPTPPATVMSVALDGLLAVPDGGGATIAAAQGTFSLAGSSAGLRAARLAAMSSGSYSEAGQAAGLRADRTLTMGAGDFHLTGIDAEMARTRVAAAGTGAFDLLGRPADLTSTGEPAAVVPPGTTVVGGGGWTTKKPDYLLRRVPRFTEEGETLASLLATAKSADYAKTLGADDELLALTTGWDARKTLVISERPALRTEETTRCSMVAAADSGELEASRVAREDDLLLVDQESSETNDDAELLEILGEL